LPAHIRGGHLLIGNFDGVHIGHRKMIDCMRALAGRHRAPVVVMTFEPHPQAFVGRTGSFNRLTGMNEKVQLLTEQGVDDIVIVDFDDDLAALSQNPFNLEHLWHHLEPKSVAMGANFQFGHCPVSGADFATVGRHSGLDIMILSSPIWKGDVRVTSDYIRSRLMQGDIHTVNHLLGRRWTLRGTVVHGDKRGRELGFPTINLAFRSDAHFALGIYAVRVQIGGTIANGVASYGTRPQFDNGPPRLEIHIFDFDGDLYGSEVLVEFVGFQRSELVFPDVEALLQQMHVDCAEARRLLGDDMRDQSIESIRGREFS